MLAAAPSFLSRPVRCGVLAWLLLLAGLPLAVRGSSADIDDIDSVRPDDSETAPPPGLFHTGAGWTPVRIDAPAFPTGLIEGDELVEILLTPPLDVPLPSKLKLANVEQVFATPNQSLSRSVPPFLTGPAGVACAPGRVHAPGYTKPDFDFDELAGEPGTAVASRPRLGLFNDLRYAGPAIRNDLRALVTWRNGVVIGVAAGGAVLMRQHLDEEIRANTFVHGDRWGRFSSALETAGNPWLQGSVLAGMYGYSLWQQDDEAHRLSVTLLTAYKFAGLGSWAIQGATHLNRPIHEWIGGPWAFPSEQAATSFAIAAVLEEYYGWPAGIPAYLLAGLVGWSRIDGRDNDLSGVFFGAAFGYVIGHSIALQHFEEHAGLRMVPFADPLTSSSGVALQKSF
jgi:hypothetical protein